MSADEICIEIDGCPKYGIHLNKEEYKNEQEVELVKQILGIQDKENIKIKSIFDERMFVACLIRDNAIAHMPFLKNLDNEITPHTRKEAEKIYEFIFLDKEGDCSCQSSRMLNDTLRTHIYDRWVDYGTFHGITEYSFVCATGEADFLKKSVINPFLTSYVDMVKLVLAQRAALTRIEDEILEIIEEEDNLEQIKDEWKKYVRFHSRLCLPEVTFQQQGVELYQMLKESFKINEIDMVQEEKLDKLHNIAELEYQRLDKESDDKLNNIVNFMAAPSLTLALISMSQDFLVAAYIVLFIFWFVRFFISL